MELEGGIELPFSRGVSFYQVENGSIVFARDIVEPGIKIGGAALQASRPAAAAAASLCALAPATRRARACRI